MTDSNTSHKILFVFLAAVVAASGCVQNSSTDLNPDFQLDYDEIDLNSSGEDLYQSSMAQIDSTNAYSVEADNRMAMNLPVISLSVNMSSEGVFETNSSEINSSGTMSLGFGGNSNSTEFNTQVETSENSTVISMNGNHTEVERYGREELGVSLEALKAISVENASILGSAQLNGEENILLDLEANSSDLMSNSETIFEVHSPVQESVDNGQGMSEIGSFNETEAYLWVERDSRTPSKFAYYGSANNGALQIRSVTEYIETE